MVETFLAPAYETRGIWLHLPAQPELESLERQIIQAAREGFNLLVLDAFLRGFPLFPTRSGIACRVKPAHAQLRRQDLFGYACAIAREHGLYVVAGVQCLDLGDADHYPRSPFLGRQFRQYLNQPAPAGLFGFRSSRERVQLCPSSPYTRQLLAELATELADGYAIDGLLLHGLCFGLPEGPQAGHCHCTWCVKRFHAVEDSEKPSWDIFRIQQLSAFLTLLKARARKSRRSLLIYGTPVNVPAIADESQHHLDDLHDNLFEICIQPAEAPVRSSSTATLTLCSMQDHPQGTDGNTCELGFLFDSASCPQSDRWRAIIGLTEPHPSVAEQVPLRAARHILEEMSLVDSAGQAEAATACLALWPADDEAFDSLLLERIVSRLETVLPEPAKPSENPEEDARTLRCLALLHLALMQVE